MHSVVSEVLACEFVLNDGGPHYRWDKAVTILASKDCQVWQATAPDNLTTDVAVSWQKSIDKLTSSKKTVWSDVSQFHRKLCGVCDTAMPTISRDGFDEFLDVVCEVCVCVWLREMNMMKCWKKNRYIDIYIYICFFYIDMMFLFKCMFMSVYREKALRQASGGGNFRAASHGVDPLKLCVKKC